MTDDGEVVRPPETEAADVLRALLTSAHEGQLSATPVERHWLAGAVAALDLVAAQGQSTSPTSASA